MTAFELTFEYLDDATPGLGALVGDVREGAAHDQEVVLTVGVEGPGWSAEVPHRLHAGRLVRPIPLAGGGFATLDDLGADATGPRTLTRGDDVCRVGGDWDDPTRDLSEEARRSRIRADIAGAILVDGVLHWPRPEPVYGVTMRDGVVEVRILWGRDDGPGVMARLPIDGAALDRFAAAFAARSGHAVKRPTTEVEVTPRFATTMTDGGLVATEALRLASIWIEPALHRMLRDGSTLGFELEAAFDRRVTGSGRKPEDDGEEIGLVLAAAEVAPSLGDLAHDPALRRRREEGVGMVPALLAGLAAAFAGRPAPNQPRDRAGPGRRPTLAEAVSWGEVPPVVGTPSGERAATAGDVAGMVTSPPEPPVAVGDLGFDSGLGGIVFHRPLTLLRELIRHGVVGDGDDHATVLEFADVTCVLWIRGWAATIEAVARPSPLIEPTLRGLAAAGRDRYVPEGLDGLRDVAGRGIATHLVTLAREASDQPMGTIVFGTRREGPENALVGSASIFGATTADVDPDEGADDGWATSRHRPEGVVLSERVVEAIGRTHAPCFVDHAAKVGLRHPNLASAYAEKLFSEIFEEPAPPAAAMLRAGASLRRRRDDARHTLVAWLEARTGDGAAELAADARRIWGVGREGGTA